MATTVLAVALTSACGGRSTTALERAASDQGPSSTAPNADRATTTTKPADTSPASQNGDASQPATGSQDAASDLAARSDTGSPEDLDQQLGSVEIAVEFESACVRPGQQQAITIRTEPEIGVAYHAIYADGKTGFDPDYYGGNNGGQTDRSGVWRDTWLVKTSAPPGHVRVDVVAQAASDNGYQEAGFEIARADGTCSA